MGDIGEVLGVVEHGDGVEVGAETQYLTATFDEAFEWRARAVVVVPRDVVQVVGGRVTPGAETALRMIADPGARGGAHDLGQDSHVRLRRGAGGVERLRAGEQGRSLGLGSVVDPIVIVSGAEHHQPRVAGTADHLVEGADQEVGVRVDQTEAAEAPVHDGVVFPDGECDEVVDQSSSGESLGHDVSLPGWLGR